MDHIQNTNMRIAPQRQKIDYPFNIKEEIKATERLNARKAGSAPAAPRTEGRRRWFSNLQGRIRANPGPLFLIGSGVMIGWFSILRNKRRHRAIIMRDFSEVSKEIHPNA